MTYVLFEKLATIEGSVMFNASSLQSFEFPVLTTVGQDLNLQGLNEENTAAGSIASLEIPELTSVGGVLSVNNLAKLTSMSFLKLKETGGLDFHTVPVMLETINLPEIETVNGSIIMEANMEAPPTGSFVPQRNDVLQAEIDSLNEQINDATSIEKVETIATKKYGMVQPDESNYITIRDDKKQGSSLADTIKKEAYN